MAFYGAWASSVFLGRWGQAEAPEAIMIPIRDLIKVAETPEDWAEIDEHLRLAEELSNTSKWEELILWSPFAAVKGIMDKVRGVAEGTKILRETAENVRNEQSRLEEQGESDFAKERREANIAEEERQSERFDVIDEERSDARDKQAQEESDRFEKIEADRKTAKAEKAQAESDRFDAIDESRKTEKLRVVQILQEVWRLRGLGGMENKARADALELTAYQ